MLTCWRFSTPRACRMAGQAAFDSQFGLPQARLHVVTAIAGSPTPYLANGEELGDAEMVHAFAPGATLDIGMAPTWARWPGTTTPADERIAAG